jgi:hypothetical protein
MRVVVRAALAVMIAASASSLARAEVKTIKGTFVGPGTYATAEGCKKLKAIAAGTERNVTTVPDTLTEDGFLGWEGGCSFASITEIEKGKKWRALMHCAEGSEEGQESDIFERTPDGKLNVTVMDTVTVFERCDGEKGK